MLNMIPLPTGVVREETGTFKIPPAVRIQYGEFEKWCVQVFLERSGLEEISGGNFGAEKAGQSSDEACHLTLLKDNACPEEGYRLTVTHSGIMLQASSEKGVVHGLTTVVSIQEREMTEMCIPCCHIEDAPRFSHRGLNLDCSRHFFPAEEVKRIIEEMALVKMNVFHWHLCDDQGWRIESKVFPLLNAAGDGYYTGEQLREVVEYAALRGVEVIPEIDLPGHTTGILAAYPQYSCFEKGVRLAAGGGIFPVILCAGKEEVFVFLEELLDEILPLFPGDRCHIGGDEAPKSQWEKCPHCAKRMEQLGLTSYEDLQGYFMERVCKLLKKHGKQAVCWNEILMAKTTPQNVQVQYWFTEDDAPMKEYISRGGQWIYSYVDSFYFDYPYGAVSLEKVYHARPGLASENWADSTMDSRGLVGMEGCLWTEHISERKQLEEHLFPRMFALAENCWRGPAEYEGFKQRLKIMLTGAPHNQLFCRPWAGWDPEGDGRRREVFDFKDTMEKGLDPLIRQQRASEEPADWEKEWEFWKMFLREEDKEDFRQWILK